MQTFLYLDSEANPKTNNPWSIARSYREAKTWVRMNGIPNTLSIAYDLANCDEMTGEDFAIWLNEQAANGKLTFPSDFQYTVHTGTLREQKAVADNLKQYAAKIGQ